MEWPINAGGKEKLINDATTVACSDQVDVIGISGGVLGGNPGDQLQDKADVISLYAGM